MGPACTRSDRTRQPALYIVWPLTRVQSTAPRASDPRVCWRLWCARRRVDGTNRVGSQFVLTSRLKHVHSESASHACLQRDSVATHAGSVLFSAPPAPSGEGVVLSTRETPDPSHTLFSMTMKSSEVRRRSRRFARIRRNGSPERKAFSTYAASPGLAAADSNSRKEGAAEARAIVEISPRSVESADTSSGSERWTPPKPRGAAPVAGAACRARHTADRRRRDMVGLRRRRSTERRRRRKGRGAVEFPMSP